MSRLWALPLHRIRRFESQILPQDQPATLTNNAPDQRPFLAWRRFKSVKHGLTVNDKVALQYTVNYDGDGFRVIPGEDKKKKIDHHVILAGCSWVFGNGVEDADTFPAALSRLLPTSQVINLGIPGGGVAEQLFLWRYADFRKKIKSSSGVYVYVYINFHHERFQRTPSYLAWAMPMAPTFHRREKSLVYAGVNTDHWDYRFTKWLSGHGLAIYWLRLYSWMLPWQLQNTHVEMAQYLFEVKQNYLRQYPGGRFVVFNAFAPHEMNSRHDSSDFRTILKSYGIEVIDRGPIPEGKWNIPYDGHPNAKKNELYAERINTYINQLVIKGAW